MKDGLGLKLFPAIFWGILLGNILSVFFSVGISALILTHYYSLKEYDLFEWAIIALFLAVPTFGASILIFFMLCFASKMKK